MSGSEWPVRGPKAGLNVPTYCTYILCLMQGSSMGIASVIFGDGDDEHDYLRDATSCMAKCKIN